ncbi:glycosyltransferase family 2 protein [Chryseobacterium sp.]|uniref:glycosyltransferase family 2 protein n=1 Tax=Chryseobacterium sp. TaxID=1871047 RepID=UPI002896BD29|nr:glycosyltransferase family 2 protein [Chryseobacterium sp.]
MNYYTKFSLITATLGRVEEIEDLLISLTKQSYKNFELIIVDQNTHRLIENIVQKYDDLFPIIYIRSDRKGLSYNRNIGITKATGDIIGFPDDDCTYSEHLLENVKICFDSKKSDFVLLSAVDPITNLNFIPSEQNVLNKKSILRKCISFNVFTVFKKDARFDAQLGVGAYFGSGEETDYMWNVLNESSKGYFAENAEVYHPSNLSSKNTERAYKYGLGFGALFKKEFLRTKKYSVLFEFLIFLIRSFVAIFVTKNRLFYYKTLIGRFRGFLMYKPN